MGSTIYQILSDIGNIIKDDGMGLSDSSKKFGHNLGTLGLGTDTRTLRKKMILVVCRTRYGYPPSPLDE